MNSIIDQQIQDREFDYGPHRLWQVPNPHPKSWVEEMILERPQVLYSKDQGSTWTTNSEFNDLPNITYDIVQSNPEVIEFLMTEEELSRISTPQGYLEFTIDGIGPYIVDSAILLCGKYIVTAYKKHI